MNFNEFKVVLPEEEIAARANVIKDLVKSTRHQRKYAEDEIASFEERMEEELSGRFSLAEDGVRWHDGNFGDEISENEMAERKAEHVRDDWGFDSYQSKIATIAACDSIITRLTTKW